VAVFFGNWLPGGVGQLGKLPDEQEVKPAFSGQKSSLPIKTATPAHVWAG
jgi:hypothetical protein